MGLKIRWVTCEDWSTEQQRRRRGSRSLSKDDFFTRLLIFPNCFTPIPSWMLFVSRLQGKQHLAALCQISCWNKRCRFYVGWFLWMWLAFVHPFHFLVFSRFCGVTLPHASNPQVLFTLNLLCVARHAKWVILFISQKVLDWFQGWKTWLTFRSDVDCIADPLLELWSWSADHCIWDFFALGRGMHSTSALLVFF